MTASLRPARRRRPQAAQSRLPSREQLASYLADNPDAATFRDLVRAFALKGRDRALLRERLRELDLDGDRPPRPPREPGSLPAVAVLEVTALDADGELIAQPSGRTRELPDPPPEIRLAPAARGPAPTVGDRVLARLSPQDDGYQGQIIRVLPRAPARFVAVVEGTPRHPRLRPLGARAGLLELDPADDLAPGDLVVAERSGGRALGRERAVVVERLGRPGEAGAISLIAAHAHDLPLAFPPEVAALGAADAPPVVAEGREDLRGLPLVTIDGADARDFDDAVFAAPDDDPANPGGWQVLVAIADVAHYVRPGEPLDREARARGNSVYFPDRVLPMLPEFLSNDLCSLRPDQDRPCVAVRLWLDAQGKKRRHRFLRGLMRSRARLTYEQLQAAQDGAADVLAPALVEPVVRPLFGAYAALQSARRQRGTLDLDLPEVMIRFDEESRPVAALRRERLDAHRLIEEFMIAANVAAAETLEQAGRPCMYRVHDRPDQVKLEALAELLRQLGLTRSGDLARPKDLARLLERVAGHELAPLISTLVLRAQSQAVYSPHNIGHYGLNLGRYAHFTSPIRRYADLVVHRALLAAQKLGEGALDGDADAWPELGVWLSRCERRAMEAERVARARFMTLLLEDEVGSAFDAMVVGVQRFGLFVQLTETLAEGLVPVASLGAEYFVHDPGRHALIGQSSGTALALGDWLRVELVEVDELQGQLTFRLLEHTPGAAAQAAAGRWRKQPRRAGRLPHRRRRR